MEEKKLAIKKELISDKPDWNKIENLINEKSKIEGQEEFIILKNKEDLKVKFGITEDLMHQKNKDKKHKD